MTESQCRIEICIRDFRCAVEGSEEFASAKVEEYLKRFVDPRLPTFQVDVGQSEDTTHQATTDGTQALDVGSFVEIYRKMNPKNNYDKVLVALYDLEKTGRIAPATVAEVENKLWQVREKVKGVSVYLTRLCKSNFGYATPETKDGKSAFRLVKKGLEFVEGRIQ